MRAYLLPALILYGPSLTAGQSIFFPNAACANHFHDGDTIVVEFENSFFMSASLSLTDFTGDSKSHTSDIPVQEADTEFLVLYKGPAPPGINVVPIPLRFGQQPQCHIQLTQEGTTSATPAFSILARNDTTTIWFSSNSSSLQNVESTTADAAQIVDSVSAAIASMSPKTSMAATPGKFITVHTSLAKH